MGMRSIFADTGYFIALLSQTDALHLRALSLANTLAARKAHLTTTDAVLIETLDGFARHHRRDLAAAFIAELDGDANVAVVPTTTVLFHKGLNLFTTRSDKTWSMTDCLSFVVMRERKITRALAADRHFVQAGFEALLLA